MTPGALDYLADTFEPRAPGLAVVLRNWALVVEHDLRAVARESLDALARAQLLAGVVPEDALHREAIEVLDAVFLSVARAVFARDARRSSMPDSKLDQLAKLARAAAVDGSPLMMRNTAATVLHHLRDDEELLKDVMPLLSGAVRLGLVAHPGDPWVWSTEEEERRSWCVALGALLEVRILRAELAELRAATTIRPEDVCDAR